ncbi:MAG: ribonuclease T2 [Caulobacter sp.]|nr:ribonuclease T2 [Caulobacter sp.]
MRLFPLISVLALIALAAGCAAPESAEVAAKDELLCVVPAAFEQIPAEVADPDKINADFTPDSYLLSLAWQPEACRAGATDTSDATACGGNLGWTLHGLWPNSADGHHPRYCRPSTRLSDDTVRRNFCMTPSARLQQHEWAAHGTCAWNSPDAYFDQARSMWEGLRRPDPRGLAGDDDAVSAGALRDAFVAANPGLPRQAIYIATGDGDRLRELRICHDLAFKPTACPGSIGAPDRVSLAITR